MPRSLVPEQGWEPVLWLLPSFGLMATTLALGSWFPVRGGGVGARARCGSLAAAISCAGGDRCRPDRELRRLPSRGPGRALLVVTLVAGASWSLRRDAFDLVDIGRTS